jgi:HPt (histidine-containing phosphotransfer) domain-containing protein
MQLRFWQGSKSTPRQEAPPGAAPARATPAKIAAELEAIRLRFISRLREDYDFLTRYRATDGSNSPQLVAIVHRMAGSAGLVGFPEISAVAGRLDDALADPAHDPQQGLDELLAMLKTTISKDQLPG